MSFKETLTKIRVATYKGTEEFDSLKEAQIYYPDLDPYKNGKRFTQALDDGDALRFEEWAIYNSYD